MQLVLFGAGRNLHWCYELLCNLSGKASLTCVCDNDVKRIDTQMVLSDGTCFSISSVQAAIEAYPNAIYWVTPKEYRMRHEMISQLIAAGIPRLNIITCDSYNDYLQRSFDFRYYVKKSNDVVTAFIPIELCFTADLNSVPWYNGNTAYNKIYNQPIMKKKTLLDMYRFFMNGHGYDKNAVIPEYERRLSSKKISGIDFDYLGTVEKFSEHEYWHFYQMNNQLCQGNLKFFFDIAPWAKYIEKNRAFCMSDGTHRAILFYLHGYRYIPLKISAEDYEKFLNQEKLAMVHKAFQVCMEDKIDYIPPHAIPVGNFSLKYIYTPILNPAYYDITYCRDANYQSRIDLINEYFSDFSFENKMMIDIGANLAYASHNFARQGAKVTALEYVKQRADLAKALTSLYYLDDRVTIVKSDFFEYVPSQKFDIGLILAIFDHWSTKIDSDGRDFLIKIDEMINDMLIWESGNRPEMEKKWIIQYTKFRQYHRISFTFGTGKCRELGVFTRPDFCFD